MGAGDFICISATFLFRQIKKGAPQNAPGKHRICLPGRGLMWCLRQNGVGRKIVKAKACRNLRTEIALLFADM